MIGGHFPVNMMGTVEIFGITDATITQPHMGPGLPYQIKFASTVVHPSGEYVYVIGGINIDNEAISDVWMYDVKCSQWSHLQPLFDRRSHATAFMLENVLYVTGGQAQKGQRLGYMECFNISQKDAKWKRCNPSPLDTVIVDPVSCVLNGSVWISGVFSYDHDHETFTGKTLYQWKPRLGKREGMADIDRGWVARGMTTNGNLIYMTGVQGIDRERAEETMEVFDPGENSWKMLQPSLVDLYGTGAAYIFGQIIVPGGKASDEGQYVYIYNLKTNTWVLSGVRMIYAQYGCSVAVIPSVNLP